MSVSQNDSLIGSVLGGRYEIVARVNRGGTAVVYRGIDRRLGRTVAVKVIHSDLSGDPDYVKRFDREARAAAILSHPNIVAVFDQGHASERPYIVMEYIRGQSLRSIIASSAPLPPTLALGYIHEVAKALAAAHDAGIIHRDIKPENVLITNDGQVKVTDFGLAKSITAQTSTASHGVLMGTMSYIAPEIPQSGASSKASDIYSTGIMLYEMLTGKKPHTGDDLSQVLYKHVHEDIGPPSAALAGQAKARIPDYVDALVMACTSRNPELRPADGRALEEKVAKAQKALDAGLLHDAELVREFSGGASVPEKTPVAPTSFRPPVVVPGREDTPPQPPAPKLAKVSHPRPAPRTAKKKFPVGILILVVAVVLAGSGFGYWAAVGRWTQIPIMAGMNEQDATALAQTDSLQVDTLQAYSETIDLGKVIRSEPEQGKRVTKGSKVTLYISKGPERYDMPTVVGLSEADARAAIATAHMAMGTVTQDWSETVAEGLVISASHDAGESLKPDTPIDLVISKGREPITITSYVGQPQDSATQGLTDAGFQVIISDDCDNNACYSATVPAGSVISQDPDGCDDNTCTGYRGDTITLLISKGPRMIEVPAVRGKFRNDAITTLKNAGCVDVNDQMCGFNVSVDSSAFPLGYATGTNPDAGQMVAAGSTVTLYIV